MMPEKSTGSAGILPAPRQDILVRRSRGYLPHFDHPGLLQMVTFRLADALPAGVAGRIAQERGAPPADRWRRIERYLDARYGACLLRHPVVARITRDALLRFDGVRYHLLAWVIMPNHVHVLVETIAGHALAGIVHSWKSFTASAAKTLGRTGVFWQREYFDRAIRDERHLLSAVDYIHRNPCLAGLVAAQELWEFSSARGYAEGAGRMPALPEDGSLSSLGASSTVG